MITLTLKSNKTPLYFNLSNHENEKKLRAVIAERKEKKLGGKIKIKTTFSENIEIAVNDVKSCVFTEGEYVRGTVHTTPIPRTRKQRTNPVRGTY